ncbi:MAG TPA: methyltransferase domain-containing protein [Acidimicrobiia bacterium]|nr:methyltransferase domain-containing protein [Acidimicrobiia bacterium]
MTERPWQSYDPVAGAYDRAWHPSFELVARDLLDLVALESHDAMLDVGTGTGVAAAAAAEQAGRGVVVGIDPSLPMLHLARQHAIVPLAAARTPGLPFPTRTFDVVVANLVISHLERCDAGLGDMVRVLRPGGRLGVTTWGSFDDEPVDDGQQRQLTGIWRSIAGHFVDMDAATEVVDAAIPWEAWFGDPAHLRGALEGSGLRRVDLTSRTYWRCVSQRDALAGYETSFWGRYLRHTLGDTDWARFRREVAGAAARVLPDPITRVDQLLIGVGTKRFATRP